ARCGSVLWADGVPRRAKPARQTIRTPGAAGVVVGLGARGKTAGDQSTRRSSPSLVAGAWAVRRPSPPAAREVGAAGGPSRPRLRGTDGGGEGAAADRVRDHERAHHPNLGHRERRHGSLPGESPGAWRRVHRGRERRVRLAHGGGRRARRRRRAPGGGAVGTPPGAGTDAGGGGG